jgi:hypothetical protein
MMDESFLKLLSGEKLTDEEAVKIRAHNARYAIARSIYLEKVNSLDKNSKLVDFHFTPGENWDKTPILDIVNEMVNWHMKIMNGDIKPMPLNFDEL